MNESIKKNKSKNLEFLILIIKIKINKKKPIINILLEPRHSVPV